MPISGVNLTPRPTAVYASDPALPRRPQDSLPSCLLGFERTRLALASSYQLSYRTSGSSAIAGFRPHRSHRAALPQWALQKGPETGRSSVPGLMDDRFGEWEGGQDLLERLPGHAALLASFAECLSPKPDDAVFESAKCPVVEDDPVVLTMSSQYLTEPLMLFPYGSVHPSRHFLTEDLQFPDHAFRLRFPFDHEPAAPGLAAVVREAQEVSGRRSPAACRRWAANRPNAISRVLPSWSDRPKPVFERHQELLPIRLMLTAQHQVIRVSADDNLSCCLLPSPLVDPEVDDIMEEDICQNRADPRPLRCPHFHRFPSAALEDAGLEPPLDQAENPAVGNPVRDHPQQPSVVDGIKEGADVDIEHIAHLLRHQGFIQGSQGRLRAAPRPEAVAEPQEVGLIDGSQHLGHRPLDNLVLQGGDAERAAAAIWFRDIRAAYRLGPVLPAVNPLMPLPEIGLQVLLILIHRHPIHPGTGRAPLPPERSLERGDVDVVQQCREPCLARPSGRLIHTPEVRQQGLPALCPALRLLRRDPFLPLPFLHHLVSFGDFIDTMERSDSHPRCGDLWLSLDRCPQR